MRCSPTRRVSLITESRIKTTLAKAKAVRPFAEKMVTLGKKNTLHSRRTALANLRHNEEAVRVLFTRDRSPLRRSPRRLHPHRQARQSPQRRRADGVPRVGGCARPVEAAPEPEKKAKGKKAGEESRPEAPRKPRKRPKLKKPMRPRTRREKARPQAESEERRRRRVKGELSRDSSSPPAISRSPAGFLRAEPEHSQPLPVM